MLKESGNRTKRLKKLIVTFSLTAIILAVSTYAWFVGMQIVNVSPFEVEIAAVDSLSLSLNGVIWADTVTINKDNYNDTNIVYSGHQNSWGGDGLIPMSSVGVINPTSSRLELYEKASFTPTKGGYRLLASKVNNHSSEDGYAEKKGYVAFDLFIRNLSGTQYIAEYNILDEEAIYLTTDSEVTVASDGVANTGIENSVRVAFAQIGRVSAATTDAATITGISCGSPAAGVTPICNAGGRKATIWEPNDKNHNENAIKWYQLSCRPRTGEDVTDPESYDTEKETSGSTTTYKNFCGNVADGQYYPTYAVNSDITSADNVDVYDGAAYNTYTGTTKLTEFDYFTDTEKNLRDVQRPLFMELAPNSITKVRVYIYIEGQDIDNYDLAQVGKAIKVKFGFTKQRFTEGDISYDGPNTELPKITLKGANPLSIAVDGEFVEPGFVASDAKGNNITSSVTVDTSKLDLTKDGTYQVIYRVTDASGSKGRAVRTVIVGNGGVSEED